jgi:threonine synthase
MDKLFSYYLPSLNDYQFYVNSLIQNNRIGNLSGILNVGEDFIGDALEISKKQSINCEPSGIAGLALLLQMKEEIPSDEKILIVNTGRTIYPA